MASFSQCLAISDRDPEVSLVPVSVCPLAEKFLTRTTLLGRVVLVKGQELFQGQPDVHGEDGILGLELPSGSVSLGLRT